METFTFLNFNSTENGQKRNGNGTVHVQKTHCDTILFSKWKLSLPSSFAEHKGWTQACALRQLRPPLRDLWNQDKGIWSANETPQAQQSSTDSQSRGTPTVRVCVCASTCARPGRQSAGTCRFNPNHHEISPLWQQNLLAFPCTPTNGLLTLQPRNDWIKGHATFQKTFFSHF